MATKAIHSARIGPAQFEVDIDDYGVVLRRTDPEWNESARIGRPIICSMEQSDSDRSMPPGLYVCKSWGNEPSIYVDDLSDDEVVAFSREFGIPVDEWPITAGQTFRRSPAGIALDAHVRSHSERYVGVEEVGAPAHGSNVDSTSRWFLRKSIEEAELADEDAERLTPGF